ncbi:MAG: hypothetical protein QXV85_09895 [Candidatus Bathyarchaeia archaeon]
MTYTFLKCFSVAAYYCISPPLLSTLLKVPCPQEMFLISYSVAVACIAIAFLQIAREKVSRIRTFFTILSIMRDFYEKLYAATVFLSMFTVSILISQWIGAVFLGILSALAIYLLRDSYKQCVVNRNIYEFMVRI